MSTDRTCSVDGCERPFYGRGYCSAHYSRWRRGKPLVAPLKRRRYNSDEACSVSWCDRRPVSDGMCSVHCQRHRLGIPMDAPHKSSTDGECSLAGCNGKIKAKGFCAFRHQRALDAPIRRKATACSIDGCVAKPSGLGYCSKHYYRLRRHGDPLYEPKPKRRNAEGYVIIHVDGRRRTGHRVVMEQILGRPLQTWENVHHKNGIRDDNHPENLELWVVPPTKGQRPEDLAEWVVGRYPELVEAALAHRKQLRLLI